MQLLQLVNSDKIKNLTKRLILPIAFVLAACAIAAVMILNLMYTNAYAVYIDDELWGYVTDTDSVDDQVRQVEEDVGAIREEDYTLECNLRYEPAFVQVKDIVTLDNVYDYFYDSVDDIVDNYILKVDDEVIGMGDYAELSDAIDDVKDQYTHDNTIEVTVLSNVAIDYETVPSETDDDIDNIENTLNEVSTEKVTYQTQEGDTLENILADSGLTETAFFALNPGLEKTTDEEGNEIVTVIPEEEPEEEISEDAEGETEDEDTPPEEGEDAEVLTVVVTDDGNMEEIEEDLREGELPEGVEIVEDINDIDINTNSDAAEDTEDDTDNENADTDTDSETEEIEEIEETDETVEAEPIDSEGSEDETVIEEEEKDPTPIDQDIEVVVAPQKATLVVETKDIEKHDEVVRYVREIKETDELYAGEMEIETEGVNGTVEVSETVVFQNGTEIDRYESDREITEEPVNEVILLGTKELATVKAYDPSDENTASGYDAETGVYYASGYLWPLQNYGMGSISSGYGWRYLNGTNEFHSGIDIAAAGGTPILASKAGTVITNTYNSARGWYIQVDHHDGFITLYQHMNAQSSLAVGTEVAQGQTVGYVGNTGYSFGNHLHFEVWTSDGSAIDPMSVFSGTATVQVINTSTDNDADSNTDSGINYEGSDEDYNTGSTNTNTNTDTDTEEEAVSEEISDMHDAIVAYAESFEGCPYVWGGHGLDMYQTSTLISYVNSAYGINVPYSLSTPADVRSYTVRNYGISVPYVFDCSGFTGFVYRHFGYDMPLTVEGQIALGTYVPCDVNAMQPGDLIFFATTGTGSATHVGMYVGNGQYIHASSTYGAVVYDTVRSTASRPIVAVRRIVS